MPCRGSLPEPRAVVKDPETVVRADLPREYLSRPSISVDLPSKAVGRVSVDRRLRCLATLLLGIFAHVKFIRPRAIPIGLACRARSSTYLVAARVVTARHSARPLSAEIYARCGVRRLATHLAHSHTVLTLRPDRLQRRRARAGLENGCSSLPLVGAPSAALSATHSFRHLCVRTRSHPPRRVSQGYHRRLTLKPSR